ncbi:hybrid sensor histidine kinase/response regulator [Parachlamydia sp.]|uniref:hybrid sensor histidine kinase/response regulator n=1 Tax=Parachlamydia sp. TaxID=2052048 RepID=UPI003D0D4F33
MIEDEELRILFEAESEEKIHSIESNLKKIETNFHDETVWNELLRDAHTLKGSARLLKIKSIEIITHRFEGILQHLKASKSQIFPGQIKLCYEILDAIHLFTEEEIGKAPARVDISELLEKASHVMQEEVLFSSSASSPKLPPPRSQKDTSLINKIKKISQRKDFLTKTIAPHGTLKNQDIHISTVRVNFEQINQLMNEVTELNVVKTTIEQLNSQIDSLVETWEEKKILSRKLAHTKIEQLNQQIEDKLNLLQNQARDPIHKLQVISSKLIQHVRRLTLLPISKLFDLFPTMIRELALSLDKEVEFIVSSEGIGVDRKIIDNLKDPLTHILRNAIAHGIEPPQIRKKLGKNPKGKVELKAFQTEQTIVIEIIDDGSGLDFTKIKQRAMDSKLFTQEELDHKTPQELIELIFLPGFSTSKQPSDIAGRGIGLDIVKKMVQDCSGHLRVRSQAEKGCAFSIELPIEFVTNHVLLISQNGGTYAIPVDRVDACLWIKSEQLFSIEGQDMINISQNPYPVYFLKYLLNSTREHFSLADPIPCVMIRKFEKHIGLVVDAILEEQELVIFPNKTPLFDYKGVIGTAILKNGSVCIVIDPFELIYLSNVQNEEALHFKSKKKTILLVDDSTISRVILKHALEEKNYQVTIAEDGLQALELLQEMKFDAMITDVEMPRMNGLELTSHIRTQDYNYILPIIIISDLSSKKDEEKGLKAGANAYLTKSEFNLQNIITTLEELIK